MDNCYLCNVNLPKGEGNSMECPHSGSSGIFLVSIFLPGIIGDYVYSKTRTLQTVCDNCFAANQPQPWFIILMLLIGAISLIGITALSVWGYIKVFNGWQ